jgi:hypothetical protein
VSLSQGGVCLSCPGFVDLDVLLPAMVRYGPVKSRPSTLAEDFIRDLKATSFVDARDHAMIRMLTDGVRREELAQQIITDLSGT